jgi:hypothetical protein
MLINGRQWKALTKAEDKLFKKLAHGIADRKMTIEQHTELLRRWAKVNNKLNQVCVKLGERKGNY